MASDSKKMPCYKPGRGRQAPNGTVTYYGHIQVAAGKLPPLPPNYKDFPLPCGKCTGCRLERSRQWAVRLMHEAQQHKHNSFVTLTYKDSELPNTGARAAADAARSLSLGLPQPIDNHAYTEARTHEIQEGAASLSKADLTAFTKRLNENSRRKFGNGVKYYACGEYGDRTQRPHYHIAIFGEDFGVDRVFYKNAPSGKPLYRSKTLDRLWPHGGADIGDLTFESAAYIARYVMKKHTGPKAIEHYMRENERGEKYWLTPEFNVMSRRPGIAKKWFDKNRHDVYPHDHVISRGHPAKPPRAYDKWLEQIDPYLLADIKKAREDGPHNPDEETNARLEVRQICAQAKLNQTKRTL
ncbi:replication initiator protein [Blackfly microvirus SF02]|uniref:Replication initiator protein n=1 Tax=Blackfly microvirus SF02 TaxID=2576452 RepID=A0A4P8PLC2_9VIRU|nr:replication initiator protein [Blackfly microvirus SF02]